VQGCKDFSDLVPIQASSIMSSLKDIMDVDVEPFESQAYRRSKEAAQQQASRAAIVPSSETSSPPIDEDDNKNNIKGKTPLRRPQIKPSLQAAAQPTAARQNISRRRSSTTGKVWTSQGINQRLQSSQHVGESSTIIKRIRASSRYACEVHACDRAQSAEQRRCTSSHVRAMPSSQGASHLCPTSMCYQV